MTPAGESAVALTPLVETHRARGARLIEFGGWLMPVQYTGILEEHRAVRERAGLFDLSHMGELFVEGAEAGSGLAYAPVTNPPALAVERENQQILFQSEDAKEGLAAYVEKRPAVFKAK